MSELRKVTLIALLAASLAVLALAVYLFWDYRQGLSVAQGSAAIALDERSRVLQDRVDVLTKRVGDAELLVVVLLGTSGLYAIVFVLSSFFSAMSFARQADQSIASIRDQIGAAMGDLRELQEEARKLLYKEPEPPPVTPEQIKKEVRAIVREEAASAQSAVEGMEEQVDAISRAVASWNGLNLDSQTRLELVHYESAATALEVTAGPQLAPSLAALFHRFADIYAATDTARQRFYLNRALALSSPDSQRTSEIHYELACWFAGNRDFSHALGELALAFQHQSKSLDDRLARDIDEGGRLYLLASTPPFDKALNDLLLNMSIGIS